MNADALSDLVLAMTCGAIAVSNRRTRPGLAQACALLGLAASFGVLRFSELEFALGPHRFFSLFAACAAFPVLAVALCWPDDPIALRAPAAARAVLLAGALGLAISLLGFVWWRQGLPVLSTFFILRAAVFSKRPGKIIGALFLAGSLALAAVGQLSPLTLGPLNTMQWMHYLMAAGLLLLTWTAKFAGEAKASG